MNADTRLLDAYILTRPLGASFADWMGVSPVRGGLNWGPGIVAMLLTGAIAMVVAVLRRARNRQASRDASLVWCNACRHCRESVRTAKGRRPEDRGPPAKGQVHHHRPGRTRGRGLPGPPRVRRRRPGRPRPVHPHGPDGRGRLRARASPRARRGTRTAASRPSPT